jgi:phosphate transport system permease protein
VLPGLAGFNSLGAGIVLGIMLIPMISSLSEDALFAVPNGLRRVRMRWARAACPPSFGSSCRRPLGHRRLGDSGGVAGHRGDDDRGHRRRAAASAHARPARAGRNDDRVRGAGEHGDTPTGTLEYRTIFVVGAVLFLMTFAMNALSHRFKRRLLSSPET